MAYTDALSTADRSKSIAGVAMVHAGAAGLLVIGLATEVVPTPEDDPLEWTKIKPDPTPTPTPTATQRKKPDEKTIDRPFVVPDPPIDVPIDPPDLGKTTTGSGPTTNTGPDLTGTIGGTGSDPFVLPTPTPLPTFDPISALPKNAPSSWIRDRDYRSTWIRRELQGTASFQLGIGANGKVSDCRVTRSTGHSALDDATCKLISKRARFNPARNAQGEAISGTYSSSIQWILPD